MIDSTGYIKIYNRIDYRAFIFPISWGSITGGNVSLRGIRYLFHYVNTYSRRANSLDREDEEEQQEPRTREEELTGTRIFMKEAGNFHLVGWMYIYMDSFPSGGSK